MHPTRLTIGPERRSYPGSRCAVGCVNRLGLETPDLQRDRIYAPHKVFSCSSGIRSWPAIDLIVEIGLGGLRRLRSFWFSGLVTIMASWRRRELIGASAGKRTAHLCVGSTL